MPGTPTYRVNNQTYNLALADAYIEWLDKTAEKYKDVEITTEEENPDVKMAENLVTWGDCPQPTLTYTSK